MDSEKIGEILGVVMTFLLSTVILFYFLKFLGKLPKDWGYFNIVNILLFVSLLGYLIRRMLR